MVGCFALRHSAAASLGSARELLASGRLDNLVSCWAAVAAFSATSHTDQLQMIVLNDHEEVGSASTTGAGGPTLEQVLTRIVAARGGSSAEPRPGSQPIDVYFGRQRHASPELPRPTRPWTRPTGQ